MKTVLKFDTRNALSLPPRFQSDDVRFSDSFAEYFISHFSRPGDMVFDPFAGFGTTLYAGEKLGRRVFGVECLPERTEYIKNNLKNQRAIVCGSSLRLDMLDLPEIDLVLTSPPYMQKANHPQYPFAGYRITGLTYDDYLRDIAGIFGQIKKRLSLGAYAVIEVSNLLISDVFTPLAWDVAESVSQVMPFKQEVVIEWQGDASPAYGFGYDHSYAMIFRNDG